MTESGDQVDPLYLKQIGQCLTPERRTVIIIIVVVIIIIIN